MVNLGNRFFGITSLNKAYPSNASPSSPNLSQQATGRTTPNKILANMQQQANVSLLQLQLTGRTAKLAQQTLGLLITAFLLCLWPSYIAAQPKALQPTVSVDRSDIAMGETFRITVSQRVKGNNFNVRAPSHQPLQKDFNVIGINSNNRMGSGSGGISGVLEWAFTVQPRSAGQKTIPTLQVGNSKTRPLTLTVQPPRNHQRADRTFATVSLSTESPYVQAQVLYTVRVYLRSGLGLTDWQMGAPTADAVVVPVKQQSVFQTRIGNRDFDVIEQRWALFMQQSGSQTISGPEFIADISDGSFFSRRSREAIEVPNQTINVQAPASRFAGPLWLPASALEVNGRIVEQEEGKALRAGEPFTYEVNITAAGLTAAQLPEPLAISAASSRSYPEPTENRQAISGSGITGQRLRRIAIVPDAAGRITLPAQAVSWWDTASNTQKTATLPARQITIEANPNLAKVDTAPQQTNDNTNTGLNNANQDGDEVANTENNHRIQHPAWFYTSLLLLAAWLATLWLLVKHRTAVPKTQPALDKEPTAATEQQALQSLLSHCRNEDGKAAAAAAKKWSQLHWPNAKTHGLQACAERLGHDGLSRHFNDLDASLYSGSANSWDGKATATTLQAAVKMAQRRRNSKQKDGPMLPELYKTAASK